jgi:hypothetical protein
MGMGWLVVLISKLLEIIAQALKPVSAVAANVIDALNKIAIIIKPFVS